jgi:protoheme IX farnesyltransferase
MRTASARDVAPAVRSAPVSRLADYLELIKPRIAVMVLVTVTVGYALGSSGTLEFGPLLCALLGIALVASGSSALNQFIERASDGWMPRTANRPLPAGRLTPAEVFCFGFATSLVGILYLTLAVNRLTGALALLTWVLYVGIYTPLKRVTSLCTAVGAIPGALPPVLGWTAAGGTLEAGAFSLFAILFLWQFPHFLAIGWLYREQYERAGLRMLPAVKRRRIVGSLCVAYALVLLPVSLLPSRLSLAGDSYFLVALVLGLGYLLCTVRFLFRESERTARDLLWSSLTYLPLLFLSLTWDHFQLLQ